MRTFKNYSDAAKRRKIEETGDEGFSLIELIIVVVIIGILAAIALPLFGQIQKNAVDGATQSATKNASTAAVAAAAQDSTGAGGTAAADILRIENATSGTLTLALGTATGMGTTASTICVLGFDTAGSKYDTSAKTFKSGPGCP